MECPPRLRVALCWAIRDGSELTVAPEGRVVPCVAQPDIHDKLTQLCMTHDDPEGMEKQQRLKTSSSLWP